MEVTEEVPAGLAQRIDQQNESIEAGIAAALQGAAPDGTPPAETAPAATDAPPPPPADDAPPAVSAAPVTRESVRGMFSDPSVQAVDAPGAELPPDVPVQEPENMNDRGRNAFAELRHLNKQLRTAGESMQRQIEDLKKAQAKAAEEREQLTAALKERDDQVRTANERLGKMDLSGSIEFRQRFDQPLQQAEANLETVVTATIGGVGGTPLSPEEAGELGKRLVAMDDDAFRKYVSSLSLDAQAALIEKRNTCISLAAERKRALDDWQTTSKGLSSVAASEHAADRAIAMRKAADDAIVFNTQTLPRDRRAYVVGDPFFADDVAAVNEEFRAFMQTADEKSIARAAHAGYLLPVMNRALMTALGEARAAQEQLLLYRGIAHPGVFPSGRDQAPVAPRAPEKVPSTPAEKQAAIERRNENIESDIAASLAPIIGSPGYPQRQ